MALTVQEAIEKRRTRMREIRTVAERFRGKPQEERDRDDLAAFKKIKGFVAQYSVATGTERSHFLFGAMTQVLADLTADEVVFLEFERLAKDVEKLERGQAAV